MKKTLVAFLATAVVMSMAVSSLAQGPGPRGGGPGMGGPGGRGAMMARMEKVNAEIFAQLKLTKDQKAKVKALDVKTKAAQKALMDQAKKGGNNQGGREKFMEIRKAYQEGLGKILTKDQMTKYTSLRKAAMEKMRAEWQKQGGMMGGGPRGAGAGKPKA